MLPFVNASKYTFTIAEQNNLSYPNLAVNGILEDWYPAIPPPLKENTPEILISSSGCPLEIWTQLWYPRPFSER